MPCCCKALSIQDNSGDESLRHSACVGLKRSFRLCAKTSVRFANIRTSASASIFCITIPEHTGFTTSSTAVIAPSYVLALQVSQREAEESNDYNDAQSLRWMFPSVARADEDQCFRRRFGTSRTCDANCTGFDSGRFASLSIIRCRA